jgi:hypothetical protein
MLLEKRNLVRSEERKSVMNFQIKRSVLTEILDWKKASKKILLPFKRRHGSRRTLDSLVSNMILILV